MQPDQPNGGGQFGNQYDFIVNPSQPKKTLIPQLGGGSFMKKILLIIGGAFAVILVLWVAVSLLGGNGTNTAGVVTLAQMQEEIIRVSEKSEEATDQAAINLAINARLTMQTQQKEWLDFLAEQGTKIGDDELALKQDKSVDEKLEDAMTNNSYDQTFVEIMQQDLSEYKKQLETNLTAAASDAEKKLLQAHHDQTELLLKQVPES